MYSSESWFVFFVPFVMMIILLSVLAFPTVPRLLSFPAVPALPTFLSVLAFPTDRTVPTCSWFKIAHRVAHTPDERRSEWLT